MLYGEAGEKPAKEAESKQLAVEAARSKLLRHMCTLLSPLGFEVRAQAAGGVIWSRWWCLGPKVLLERARVRSTQRCADSCAFPAGRLRPGKTWPPCSAACCGQVLTGGSHVWPTWRSTGTCWSS